MTITTAQVLRIMRKPSGPNIIGVHLKRSKGQRIYTLVYGDGTMFVGHSVMWNATERTLFVGSNLFEDDPVRVAMWDRMGSALDELRDIQREHGTIQPGTENPPVAGREQFIIR
jgi:hypothetical protein